MRWYCFVASLFPMRKGTWLAAGQSMTSAVATAANQLE
jgi:hypothetical protein